jgi:hypothetical protein
MKIISIQITMKLLNSYGIHRSVMTNVTDDVNQMFVIIVQF